MHTWCCRLFCFSLHMESLTSVEMCLDLSLTKEWSGEFHHFLGSYWFMSVKSPLWFLLLGWGRFTLQVWSGWTFCVCWPPCITSAGLWCPVMSPTNEFSRPHALITSTWACCCWCSSSVCCLSFTPSWLYLRPSTVDRSGQSSLIYYLYL